MKLLAGGIAATTLAAALAAQVPADQQQPTFRTAVNYVRVDVYPTANGQHVGDLTAGDVEVLEDGAPQKIATFEHIVARAGGLASERLDPPNVQAAERAAADPRNRLFVLFLDTFHVTDDTAWHDNRLRLPGDTTKRLPPDPRMIGPGRIERALTTFLDRTLGPDDLIAAMTPEMDARALTFARRTGHIDELLATVWARRFSLDNLDPEEESYMKCYPPDDPEHRFDGIAEEMIARRREELTIQTLRGAVRRLGEIREERKAVLVVSEGWALFRQNQSLARQLPGLPPPGPPGIYVGRGGKIETGTDPRQTMGLDWHECESTRLRLARMDDEREFRVLLDEANRATVSFYPVDPRGLAASDTPMDYHEINTMPTGRDTAQVNRPVGVVEDLARLRGRLEVLQTLATATDGLALAGSNDLNAEFDRIAADLSAYYLIGYYSTNDKADGTFRRITVRVKRPGVEVRARRGYRALTAEAAAERAIAEVPPDPEAETRAAALAMLDRTRANRPVRLGAGSAWEAAADETQPRRPVLWVAAELDAAAARLPEWRDGVEATITVTPAGAAAAVATEQASLNRTSRAFVRHLLRLQLTPGEYLVRARLRGAPGTGADAGDMVHVRIPDPAAAGTRTLGDPLYFRRGPYTGPAYQPTADTRFRRTERLRLDVPVGGAGATVTARLLDRAGRPLAVPVTGGFRAEGGLRFATAEVVLAPLGPSDYLVEVAVRRGETEEKIVSAFRIVP